MTLRTDARRPIMLTATLVLGLALSAGCAIDKGSALAADFEQEWADTPDVAEIDTHGDNTLPFAGSATGTLILEQGTSADRVAELADELAEYVADERAVTGEISSDGLTFAVAPDGERNGQVVALWESLAADDRVASGLIDSGFDNEDRWTIEIVAVDAAGALALFKDMTGDAEQYRPFSSAVTSLRVGTGQGTSPSLRVETDHEGNVPAEAIAAYTAVAAQYPVVGGGLDPDRAGIIVAAGTDLDQAAELARSWAPNLADIEVSAAS
ncbi:hypothetical protein [Glycomyces tritici]|uniref:Uncharacterized protein n=1 Tax=Glycomyces tritici TaxID=2665176 RepID=A0ABT7YYW2_9ACTN|nr:hypothetical protein [Glycomyces tritici]MDN3243835.1 hypothetical protein [Glycomyces tritici]